ncbi:MAG: ABC transporter permease subunit [Planctomycetes bacterium]|nr:ABC transporter permease subunit [Planctomycetota bacterium]
MNIAIARKTLRDILLPLVIILSATVLFEIIFVMAMGELARDLEGFLAAREFIQRFIRALAGDDLIGDMSPTSIASFGLVHPLLLALSWTLLLTWGSHVIAGEIERGTADLLFSLPVSRLSLYVSASSVLLLCAVLMSTVPVVGLSLGLWLNPLWEPVNLPRLWMVAVNLFMLNLAIGCMALAVSSFVSRRGLAVGITLAVLLTSFFINVLAQFWSFAENISFIGLLHYYRPLPIVRTGQWPLTAMFALAVFAAVFWMAGLWQFRRRDIPAV